MNKKFKSKKEYEQWKELKKEGKNICPQCKKEFEGREKLCPDCKKVNAQGCRRNFNIIGGIFL